MNLHISRILFQKYSNYKCQFCAKIRAPSRLVSEVWAKYKHVPTKIRFVFEHYRKTSQRTMNVRKQQLRNFSGRDIISDNEFLLSVLNAFTVGTEKYYPKRYNVNDTKGLQIHHHACSIILGLEVQIINIGFS